MTLRVLPRSKYIIFKGEVISLTELKPGFWYDPFGTVYALRGDSTADPVKRCGVWPFSVPMNLYFAKLNGSCSPHDYAYDTPVYQAFHTRKEADNYLRDVLIANGYSLLGRLFRSLARMFGGQFWENDKTNN